MILSGERREGVFFDPLHPWAALKRTIVNSVESGPGNPIIYYWILFFFLEGGDFFIFWAWAKVVKVVQVTLQYTTGSEHTRVLNMLLVLNMLGLWIYRSLNIRKFFFLKYEEFIFGGFRSWNIRKAFFWENIKDFLILELGRSIFPEYNKFSLGLFCLFFLGSAENCRFPFLEI